MEVLRSREGRVMSKGGFRRDFRVMGKVVGVAEVVGDLRLRGGPVDFGSINCKDFLSVFEVQKGIGGGRGCRTAFRAGYDFGSSKCSALILLGRESRVVRKDFANDSSVILK